MPTCSATNRYVKLSPGSHRVLRDAGDAVHRGRHVDAVPVQRDAVRHVVVAEHDLDQLALRGTDSGPGDRPLSVKPSNGSPPVRV